MNINEEKKQNNQVDGEESNERIFHTIILELCKEKNIDVKKLSYDWILQLQKGDKVRHIAGNRFDINKEAAGNIACDKYATYEVLSSQNVPVVEHKMVFNPVTRTKYIDSNGIWSDVISYFNSHNNKIVIKPNNGCEGQGVYLCETLKDVENAIEKLFRSNGSLSMCPYYDIDTEYRTFYLNGNCYLVYGKTKPYVVGDGVSNIQTLLETENIYMPNNAVVSDNLSKIDMDYVPADKEKYYLSWKHNLSGGATPLIVQDENLKTRIYDLVKKAGHAANINFATIDVIKTVEDDLFVLEINSGVCMTKFIEQVEGGYDIAKGIYSKALDEMFDEPNNSKNR